MRRLPMLGAFLLVACGGQETNQQVTTPDWEPQVQLSNEVLLNQGDVARLSEFFAPTYVGHATGGDFQGSEGIAGFVTALRAAFPDLHVEVEVLATEGNRVAWLRTHRGTHHGDFMGIPASGRTVVWQEMVVTRFEAGLIAEEWGVTDLFERLQVQ